MRIPLLHHVFQHHHPRFQRCLSAAVGRGSGLFQGQPTCSPTPAGADNQGSDDETYCGREHLHVSSTP
ncbi:MAG: hypothetical protein ABSD48_14710, partial [Armatimonadota bacterium]